MHFVIGFQSYNTSPLTFAHSINMLLQCPHRDLKAIQSHFFPLCLKSMVQVKSFDIYISPCPSGHKIDVRFNVFENTWVRNAERDFYFVDKCMSQKVNVLLFTFAAYYTQYVASRSDQ